MHNQRLVSLDAFRGYTVAAMIMVNFPGNWDYVFPTLHHSEWNGLTFTDLVAPFFLFIVGMSIDISYGSKVFENKLPQYRKIALRALKIYALGMFLNAMPHFNWEALRWTGTLHRIAVVFLICSIIGLHTQWKQQVALTVILLIGYWLVMTKVPYPGTDIVMLEPGKNIAAYVDALYLPGKMWQGTWDPESLLSVIPCCATSLLGMLAGRMLRTENGLEQKMSKLTVWGVLLAASGYFWGLIFPVNENLWTSSFVLVTAGFASLVYACLIYFFDLQKEKRLSMPGVVFGMNAITAYVLGDLLALLFYGVEIGGQGLNGHFFGLMTGWGMMPELASWIYALLYVAIVSIPCWMLYRKKIFLKV